MDESNHRPWDIETPSNKISHDEYYEKRGTTDKTKHSLACCTTHSAYTNHDNGLHAAPCGSMQLHAAPVVFAGSP